jgi:hypothetical protein
MLVFALLATLIPSFTIAWISYLQNKRSLTENGDVECAKSLMRRLGIEPRTY